MFSLRGFLSLSILASVAFAPKPPQDKMCNPRFFGRPQNQDCKDALANLPDWEAISENGDADWGIIREFVNTESPAGTGTNGQEHRILTPLVYTKGGKHLQSTSMPRMRSHGGSRNMYSNRHASHRAWDLKFNVGRHGQTQHERRRSPYQVRREAWEWWLVSSDKRL